MKSCIYLDTSTENYFQHSEKMNIHLKCPEVFLPKITTLKMNWMILVSLHSGFCWHFFLSEVEFQVGLPIILYFEAMLLYWRAQESSSPPFLNHQSSKHPGDFVPRTLGPLPSTTHQTWGKNGTETWGMFNVCQGARALDIRESGYALTEHMLDLMKCTSNSRVPLGAPGRKKSEMFLFNKTPPKKQPRLEEKNMSLYYYHLLLWLSFIIMIMYH